MNTDNHLPLIAEVLLPTVLVGIAVAFEAASVVVAGLLLLLVAGRAMVRRRWGRWTPVDVALGLLVVIILFNLFITPDMPTSSVPLAQLVNGILWLMALRFGLQRDSLRYLPFAWVLAAAALMGVLFVSAQLLTPFRPIQQLVPDALRNLINPNIAAGALLLPVVGLAGYGRVCWPTLPTSEKALYSATVLAGLLAMVAAGSRGALLAALVTFGMLLFWRSPLATFLFLLAAVVLPLGVALAGGAAFIEPLFADDALGGFAGRLEIWQRARYLIQDYPVTGIGAGRFMTMVDTLYPLFLVPAGAVPHAHNLYLQIAIDFGLFGLLTWLALVGTLLVALWRGAARASAASASLLGGLAVAVWCATVAMLLHGVIDAPLWNSRVAVLLWGMWGIGLAVLQHVKVVD